MYLTIFPERGFLIASSFSEFSICKILASFAVVTSSNCKIVNSKGFKTALCEGAIRHRDTRGLYSNNLRAVGPITLS